MAVGGLLCLQPITAALMMGSAASQLVISVLKAATCIGKAALALLTGVLTLALALLALLASVLQLVDAIPAALALLAASFAAAAGLARYVALHSAARSPAMMVQAAARQQQQQQAGPSRPAVECTSCPICVEDTSPATMLFRTTLCGHLLHGRCAVDITKHRLQNGQLPCCLQRNCNIPLEGGDVYRLLAAALPELGQEQVERLRQLYHRILTRATGLVRQQCLHCGLVVALKPGEELEACPRCGKHPQRREEPPQQATRPAKGKRRLAIFPKIAKRRHTLPAGPPPRDEIEDEIAA